MIKRFRAKLVPGLFRAVLFVLGCSVGFAGSFFGLIGTQAMTGDEPFFEILLGVGAYHVIAWGMGGLIAAAGFFGTRVSVSIPIAFVAGGVIDALLVTSSLFHHPAPSPALVVLYVLVPPVIGAVMVLRAAHRS